jgi:hypothetical protein
MSQLKMLVICGAVVVGAAVVGSQLGGSKDMAQDVAKSVVDLAHTAQDELTKAVTSSNQDVVQTPTATKAADASADGNAAGDDDESDDTGPTVKAGKDASAKPGSRLNEDGDPWTPGDGPN